MFQLLDTKSTDRKQTLLHFIANVIQERYPDLNNFYSQLHFLDKAALGEQACKYSTNVSMLARRDERRGLKTVGPVPVQCLWTASCRTCELCSEGWS